MQEDPEVQPAAASTRPGGLSIISYIYIASVYCLSTHQQRWNISLALKLVSFSKTLTLSPQSSDQFSARTSPGPEDPKIRWLYP